jgi:hypothetical protein
MPQVPEYPEKAEASGLIQSPVLEENPRKKGKKGMASSDEMRMCPEIEAMIA